MNISSATSEVLESKSGILRLSVLNCIHDHATIGTKFQTMRDTMVNLK